MYMGKSLNYHLQLLGVEDHLLGDSCRLQRLRPRCDGSRLEDEVVTLGLPAVLKKLF